MTFRLRAVTSKAAVLQLQLDQHFLLHQWFISSGPISSSFLLFFSNNSYLGRDWKNCRLQHALNLDCQSRSQAQWPLVHHFHVHSPMIWRYLNGKVLDRTMRKRGIIWHIQKTFDSQRLQNNQLKLQGFYDPGT